MRSRLLLVLALLVFLGASGSPAAALDAPSGRAPATGMPARLAAQRAAAIRAGVRFVPLGVRLAGASRLAGSSQLTGIVYWGGAPVNGAEVGWAVPVGDAFSSGTTMTAADGSYTLTGVTEATGNGILAASWGNDTWGPYTVGRDGVTWPSAATSVLDFHPVSVSIDATSGGPWSSASPSWASLYGSDATSRLYSHSKIAHNGYTGNYPLTLPGVIDKAAVYFWANEGVEIDARIDTRAGSVLDPAPETSSGIFDVAALDTSTAVAARSGQLLRTFDGGLTWSVVSHGALFSSLDFADSQHGWAVGLADSLRATADGGVTWTAQTSGITPQLFSVAAVDLQHVWAVGKSGTVRATADGGANWVPQASGVTSDLWGVDFIDTMHGWAVGVGGTVIVTGDGGVSWKKMVSGTALRLWDVAFADADHGFAVGGASEPDRNVLLTTDDGGATWIKRASGTAQPLYGVDAIDSQHAWVVGEKGTILVTGDGGLTWRRQSPAVTASVGSGLSGVDMLDGQIGWATGAGSTVLATTDGGATWARQLNLNLSQADAQRFMIKSPYWASGKPGTRVKLLLQQFRKGFTSAFTGYSGFPEGAPIRPLAGYTSKGARNENKSVTVPTTAKPGYWYLLGVQNENGPLYLEAPFQVCTLKAGRNAIRRGGSVRLTCVVPTQGHKGITAGKRMPIAVYQRTTAAGQPTAWDATKRGWKRIGIFRTDGFGRYTTGALRPSRTTWYVIQYAGDDWYWGAYTSVVKVTVL